MKNIYKYILSIVMIAVVVVGTGCSKITPSQEMLLGGDHNQSDGSGTFVTVSSTNATFTTVTSTNAYFTSVTSTNAIFTLLTLFGYTPGSVLFAGPLGLVSQNNSKFYWDNTNFVLSVTGTVKTTGFQFPTGAGAGKIFTSDASGNGSWATSSGGVTSIVGTANQITASSPTGTVTLSLSPNLTTNNLTLGGGSTTSTNSFQNYGFSIFGESGVPVKDIYVQTTSSASTGGSVQYTFSTVSSTDVVGLEAMINWSGSSKGWMPPFYGGLTGGYYFSAYTGDDGSGHARVFIENGVSASNITSKAVRIRLKYTNVY